MYVEIYPGLVKEPKVSSASVQGKTKAVNCT
jgi:hypothetical protein